MNTRGHAEVADEAGLPLLRSFFGGQKLNCLEALKLGNWLTDVSQTVDPVAYAMPANLGKEAADAILADLHKTADAVLDQLKSGVVSKLPDVIAQGATRELVKLGDLIGSRIDALRKSIHDAIDSFLGGANTDERSSEVAQFFRSLFFVIGYYKFVHPQKAGGARRMDYRGFVAVFGALGEIPGAQGNQAAPDRPGSFTQYYPHEHLDRPERLKPPRKAEEPPIFEPGPQIEGVEMHGPPSARLGPRSPRSPQALPKHDLYSYLRDDMEMTAGLLAEVDRELRDIIGAKTWPLLWEALETGKMPKGLDPNFFSALEASVPLHKALAKLGHALHQVEDFFAHSNWIELAAQLRGEEYLAKVLPPRLPEALQKLLPLPLVRELLERTRTVYAKRLKRHLTQPKKNWKDHPPEGWVITGSFDLRDTLISLAHLTEEMWGGDVPDPWQNAADFNQAVQEAVKKPSTVLEQMQKLVRDASELLTRPERAIEDPENPVAKAWKEKIRDKIDAVRRPKVQQEMAEQIAQQSGLLGNAPKEVKTAFINAIVIGTRVRGAMSLYEAITTISDFLTNPLSWLRKELHLTLPDAFLYWSRELFYDYIGMDRIGCHSLMAKDHGGEPLYTPNKECATAVHYYIVHTLLKPWEKAPKPALDWLALLEFFLQNPATAQLGKQEQREMTLLVNIVHVVRAGEQLDCADPKLSLTKRYRATASGKFDWRTIADANFLTDGMPEAEAQRVINLTLKETKTGVPVTPPNYAFKPGITIVIPNQRLRVKRQIFRKSDKEPWFVTVMDKGWKIFRGEDVEKQSSVPPLNPYSPTRVSRDETELMIKSARVKRLKARQAYRPQ